MPQPTKHFHFVQVTLAGADIETAMPAAGKPVGTVAFDLTALAFYQVCQTAGDAHVWRSLGGSAAGWSKYVVSSQAAPIAPYATIQSAVAAAVADGHGNAAPAVILIMPGAYSASVNLPPGITLFGLVGDAGPNTSYKPVALAGNVTVTLAAGADRVGLFNLAVAGNLTVTGAGAGTVACGNCSFVPASGSAVVVGTADANIDMQDCVLTSLDGTPSLRSVGGATATVTIRGSTIGADTTTTAVEITNDTVTVIDTDVFGVLVIANAGVYNAKRGTWKSTGPVLGTMTTGGSSPEISVDGTAIDGKATTTFTGSAGGVVTLTRPAAVGGAIVVDPTLTTRWNELDNNPGMVRVGSFWGPVAADFVLAWGDHNVLAYLTDVGTIHGTLPLLEEVEDGYKIVVTKVHGAATLNIAPSVLGDLMNGTATTSNVATSTVFIADRIGNSWWTTTA